MLKIYGDRRSGKTTALIAIFKRDLGATLVFPNICAMKAAFRHDQDINQRACIVASGKELDRWIEGRTPKLYIDEIEAVNPSDYARRFMVAFTESC